jgi:hypothetical protein
MKRPMIDRGSVAALIGLATCGGAQAPAIHTTCPDVTNCTETNGTGVYFEEGGFAGIGPAQLMITHFNNQGTSVTFDGRFLDPGSGTWQLLNGLGRIFNARYQGREMRVVKVEEAGTEPRWTLRAPAAGSPLTFVTGPDLANLELLINASPPGLGGPFLLDFQGPPVEDARPGRPPQRYNMRWQLADAHEPTPTAYCRDAAGHDDAVVFQQGVEVEPVTGKVAFVPTSVTMSCDRGAPATVYRWGYGYAPQDAFYFGAGIQMKRASYCGDAEFFTRAGTEILIGDDTPINHRATPRDADLEAAWTPDGARCLNRAGERQPAIVAKKQFSYRCNGVELRACSAVLTAPRVPWLIDRAAPPSR